MSTPDNALQNSSKPRISLDTWAVVAALVAALLVRIGVIHRIPW
ncbi:MAG TPA: hypothetical protein VIM00_10030 [Candidatus Acidoferrum sp.]|jgi:hypothetical protein